MLKFGKIQGILPNRVSEGARSDILMDLFDNSESESDSETENYIIFLPRTEIPKSLKFNHQSFGNSISFKVGCKFPKLAVCVAFRSAEAHIGPRGCWVNVSVNGCKQYFNCKITEESYEELWLFSVSLGQLNKPNLSEQNQVEVEVFESNTDYIKWLGVNVECICCPQKSDCGAFNNEGDLGNSMEPTNTGFEPGLKGFLGDLNVSLSAPNNSELLALLPGPNMDHEVSNTVNDLRLSKGIHNDGCDLSLSLNDSNERESEPPLFPDLTNGFDFGFAQPNLELGSGVSSGFQLGVNDDSDFYAGSSSMAHDYVNDDSDFNMGPPPKKARTS